MQVKLNADVAQSLLTCDWLKNCSKAQRGACLFEEDKANMEKYKLINLKKLESVLRSVKRKVFKKADENEKGRVQAAFPPVRRPSGFFICICVSSVYTRLDSALKAHHAFDRARPAEHVHALDAPGFVTEGGQQACVARERGGVAGHVDHAAGSGLGDSAQNRLFAALARRIDDDHVRGKSLPYEARKHLLRRARAAFSFASAMASGTISMPMTRLAARASSSEIVPAPQ